MAIAAGRRLCEELLEPLQATFGRLAIRSALAEIAGVERKIHFFAMDLPHSDACFVQAYPAETGEAFCDGHNAAFAFFGKAPRSILYDNTTLAVARILGDGVRQRTRPSAYEWCAILEWLRGKLVRFAAPGAPATERRERPLRPRGSNGRFVPIHVRCFAEQL